MKPWMLAVLLFPLAAWSAPYIVSDDYPPGGVRPTHCEVVDNGAVYSSPVATRRSGAVYCKVDIARIARGRHRVMVQAVSTVTGGRSAGVPFRYRCASFWGRLYCY